jgi:hypothetical protein
LYKSSTTPPNYPNFPADTVDIAEMSETVCSLAAPKAAPRTVSLSITPLPAPGLRKTDPYTLQKAVWTFLDPALDSTGLSNTVEVAINSVNYNVPIVFGMLRMDEGELAAIGYLESQKRIREALKSDSIQLPFDITI